MLIGRFGSFFLGQIDDPVVLQLHFRKLILLNGIEKIRVSGLSILAAADQIKNTAGNQCKDDGNDQRSPSAAAGSFVIPGFVGPAGGILAIGIHQDRLLMILVNFAHHITFSSPVQRMIPDFAVNFL